MSKIKVIFIIISCCFIAALAILFTSTINYEPGQVTIVKTLPAIKYSIQVNNNKNVITTNKRVAEYVGAVIQNNIEKHWHIMIHFHTLIK